ncbi:hypothetical protein ACFQV4_23445 [Streptomyces thermocarboxydus]
MSLLEGLETAALASGSSQGVETALDLQRQAGADFQESNVLRTMFWSEI